MLPSPARVRSETATLTAGVSLAPWPAAAAALAENGLRPKSAVSWLIAILRRVHVDDIFRAIGSFAVKFRWVVLAVWVVAAVAIPKALPSLASVTQGNNSAFLPANAPSEHATTLAAPLGISLSVTPVPVVAAVPTGSFTAADQAYLATLTTDLAKVPTVTKARLLGQSQVPGPNGVAGQAAQIQVLSTVNLNDDKAVTDLVDNLRTAITDSSPPPGMQVHLAGQIAIQVDQQKQSGNTGNQVQFVALIFILLLLLVIFRSLLAPFITVIPALLSVAISGPLVAELANHGLKVSQLSQLLLIVLVLGAGTDYGLFLVFRVRERIRLGDPGKDAVVNALTKVGESITFSAATVIAALLSLLFATFQIYSSLGVPLAIGIGVMLLAGLTLLPALLAIFGRAAFWPTKIRPGTGKIGIWGRVSARIVRRPAVTLVAGLVVFGGLAFAVYGYLPGGFGGTISAPAGSQSAIGANLLSKHFPTTSANPTNLIYKLNQPVWDNSQSLAAAQKQLAASGLFKGVTGPLNPAGVTLTPAEYTTLHAQLGPASALPAVPTSTTVPVAAYDAYRASAQYVSPDGRTVQFETGLRAGDPSTTAAMNAIPAVRAETATVAKTIGAADYGVGGEAPAFYDISQISDSDLVHVIPIAIVVIGVLLALVMRSLVAPLYLIASVGLSYLAALGMSVLIFMKIGSSSGLTFILPFLMFIFLLALGEDYNILLMSRIREEAHDHSLPEAVNRALNVTGTTVTSAGLVLAGTFAVFAVIGGRGSGGSQIVDVGAGLAIGVLMDTFIVRTVLVPSTVVLLGRWNWWPSKLSSSAAAPIAGSADQVSGGDKPVGGSLDDTGPQPVTSPQSRP